MGTVPVLSEHAGVLRSPARMLISDLAVTTFQRFVVLPSARLRIHDLQRGRNCPGLL